MKDNRITELTEYFGRLGLEYGGDRRTWARNGTDRLSGHYRGVSLHVSGERAEDGKENTGNSNIDNHSMYRKLYRNYLQLSVETGREVRQPVGVLPRNDYALLDKYGHPVVNGKVIMVGGPNAVGTDLRHSRYLAVNRLLDGGVPEFDAVFGVLCDDEAYARTVLRPDLLRWIVGDARSRGARIMFNNDRVDLFLRTERLPEPPELFVPEWIFPAADYLLELIAQADLLGQ
ncbi:MAG TPA: hypothetical protein VHZ97_12515 [Pseudonocardiaceae bacterium]|nr:hypothetical protein [Pseudonocardiaceae bacterium]